VRFNEIPLVTRVPELAQAARGTQVLLEIGAIDEISLEVSCRVLEVFAGEGEVPEEDLEGDEEAAEVSAEAAAEAAAELVAETAAEGVRAEEAGAHGAADVGHAAAQSAAGAGGGEARPEPASAARDSDGKDAG
jgi:exoribonuclease-2